MVTRKNEIESVCLSVGRSDQLLDCVRVVTNLSMLVCLRAVVALISSNSAFIQIIASHLLAHFGAINIFMLFSCGRMSAYRHVAFKSLNIVLLSRFEWLDKKENLNVEMPTYVHMPGLS